MPDVKLGLAIHWTYQPFANEKFFRDMYVTATVGAERTLRSTIGTFVSDPYTLRPALTAMAIATLDEVSGGRAVLPGFRNSASRARSRPWPSRKRSS